MTTYTPTYFDLLQIIFSEFFLKNIQITGEFSDRLNVFSP
jgi:hypothetical protein